MRLSCFLWAPPLLGLWLASCQPSAPEQIRLYSASGTRDLRGAADPLDDASWTPLAARFAGHLRLRGARLPTTLRPGQTSDITLLWQVEKPLRPADAEGLQIFVHGQVPGAELNQLGADHRLASGDVDLTQLQAGDWLEDSFSLSIPAVYPADRLEVWIGLYQGKERWSAQSDELPVEQDRVRIFAGAVAGGPPTLPQVTARRAVEPITLDGVLSEPAWQQAERVGPFVAYDGRRPVRFATYARLLWTNSDLYVAFEADDDDAHTPYQKRDDPLYESEAVEIFIDADGDRDEYIELQAAPNDVHFDAAFRGGRRKNFDTTYDLDYETQTRVSGTVNDPSDRDRGFISEWRIPFQGIRDLPRSPQPGDRWQINLFRLERRRKNGRVVASEASAWSSPLSGDFHNLARFGTLQFAE